MEVVVVMTAPAAPTLCTDGEDSDGVATNKPAPPPPLPAAEVTIALDTLLAVARVRNATDELAISARSSRPLFSAGVGGGLA